MSKTLHQMTYRPDIDGLRALAVLSVVVFHINENWLPGGFLGVDIFFVISGFLITSIIYREINEGKFSFQNFYIRRIRRIFPVFFFVMIVCLCFGWYIFLKQDYLGLLKSAIASTAFMANFYFARQSGYFDISNHEKPLLHIWSLSIEEQFYFIFPVILWILCKSILCKKYIVQILILLGLILLIFTTFISFSWNHYYLFHTRATELLVGSILAIIIYNKNLENNNQSLAIISLFIVIISLIFFNKDTPLFPGFSALIPCIAVAGLIYGNQKTNIVSKLFSLKPIVWIGQISYSLYLWHWVVLALMRYVYGGHELPVMWVFIAVITMFFLSVLTYYFIEQPIRKNKMSFYKNLFLFYLIPLVVILGFYGFSKNKKDMIMADDFIYPTQICHDTLENNCIKGDVSKPTKVLFVGDSYTGHLNAFVDIVGKKEGWSAMVTSGAGCTFVFNHEPLSYRSNYEFCKKRNEMIEQTYHNYSVIVLSNHWGDRQTIDDPKFIEKFKYTLDKLVKENKTVIVTNTSNTIRTSPYRQYVLANKNLNFGFASLEYEKTAQVREQTDVIKEIVKSKPQVMWVDVTSYIPESYFVDNKPVLADVSHLNNYGARYVAKRFIDDGRVLIHSKYLKESIK